MNRWGWFIITAGVLGGVAGSPFQVAIAQIAPIEPSSTRTLELTLEDAIALLLQNNRDLKNAALERIVQRQELREAESTFDWRVQPLFGIGISQLLSNSGEFGGGAGSTGLSSLTVAGPGSGAIGGTVLLPPQTSYTRSTQVVGQKRTNLGTTITLSLDPFRQDPASLIVTQPLLRGAGPAVNEAPIQVARLNESKGQLELRQTLIERITDTGIAYRELIQAQEALRIQEVSVANQRRQLELVQILVDAGRKARAELVEVQANLAAQEAATVVTRNELAQSRSNLLQLLDLPETVQILIPEATIVALRQADQQTLQSVSQLNLETLLQTAYTKRPDYLQTANEIQTAELNLLVARNNQEWGLDLQGNTRTGTVSDLSLALVLTKVFADPQLETNYQRRQVTLQQQQNSRARLTEIIRLEVGDRLRDVNSALVRVTATEQARQLAEQRAANAQEQFNRGKAEIFRVLDLQNLVIAAQQEELRARIAFLNTLTRLDQALGITLETWENQVNASQLSVTD